MLLVAGRVGLGWLVLAADKPYIVLGAVSRNEVAFFLRFASKPLLGLDFVEASTL